MKRLTALFLMLGLLLSLAPAFGCAAASDTLTVACVGDSLTYGEIPDSFGKQGRSYPTVLGELLGEGFEVLNFGVRCATATNTHFPYRDTEEYRQSLEAAADIYLIMLGTNDSNLRDAWSTEDFETALTELAEGYRACSRGARIYLITPPVILPDAWGDGFMVDPTHLVGEGLDCIRRVAKLQDLGLIDFYLSSAVNNQWIGTDGVHMTDTGYEELAKKVYGVLRAELSLPDER